MIDGTIVCRLVKKKKGLKVVKAFTVWSNEFGWCKARSDTGIDIWFKTVDAVTEFIEARQKQRYKIEGELNMPEKVVSRHSTVDDFSSENEVDN